MPKIISPVRKDPNHANHPVQPADTYGPDELPAKVDLRKYMPPVFDQRQLESCTGNALAAAYGYLEGRVAKKEVNVSRLFIYYNERMLEGTTSKDGGACLHDGVKVLQTYGACTEDTWPYDEKNVDTKPHAAAYNEGKGHEIDQAKAVAVDLHAMKHCLAEGYPFVFIIEIDDEFKPDKNGFIKRPTGKKLSGHALTAVGYDDAKKVFIVRNSWGASWGDKGHCYLGYDWLTDPKQCFDPWTLRRGHGLDFSQVGKAGEEEEEEEDDDESDEDESDEDESDDEESDDEESEDDGEESDDEESDDEESEDDGDDEDSEDEEDGDEEEEGDEEEKK